jgi:hypothetical protein
MLFKFISVCLLYIILSNMICNDYNNSNYSNEVILTCDIENKNNSINSITSHDIDIENGLYYVYNSKKNNLISIISNVSYMSYNFLKNMKDMVYKQIKN